MLDSSRLFGIAPTETTTSARFYRFMTGGAGAMKTLLLVEDDEALGYTLSRQLQAAGYDVMLANSSMSALNVLDSDRQIDFVIADTIMPKGQPNGLAFARIARMKRLGIKVAFITGYTNLALNDNTLCARVFYKPVDLEDLVAEIDTQLSA